MEPRVSIVTPVYNGETYLAECVETVIAQTHRNWDYTIVDNQSKDRTVEIARRYAARDSRIRVVENRSFLPIIENHNEAMRNVSPESTYCKVVFADDWLYPACLTEMVAVAEAHPSIGVVSAEGTGGTEIWWTPSGSRTPQNRPASGREFLPGREVGRQTLLGNYYLFGAPTSVLYRSDLVRARPAFFHEGNMHSDLEACYDLLRESDFGFVYQPLTHSRQRDDSQSAASSGIDSYIVGDLECLLRYGPHYLSAEEQKERLATVLLEYHRILGRSLLRRRSPKYWQYHQDACARLGIEMDRWQIARSALQDAAGFFARPSAVLAGMRRWWSPPPRPVNHN